MIRRVVIAAVGAAVVGAGWIGWQRWAAANVVTLPPVPAPAHERIAPCDERPATYHLDGGAGPPPSWRAAVSAAAVDAVLVARVSGEKPQVMDAGRCLWNTAYPLAVQEVIKGTFRAGETVRVEWPGRPIDRVRDYPTPRPGEVYLLFLSESPGGGTYRLSFGAYATMRLADGKFRAITERPSDERDAREFLASLRAFIP